MEEFRAKAYPFSICFQCKNTTKATPFPYIRHQVGDKIMKCISPIHGRSFIVGKNSEDKYIVSKGNGLNYSSFPFINTGEMGADTWGLLLKQDAVRDFLLGEEISALGIKTNTMEYVLEIEVDINIPPEGNLRPYLLQYTVECPYRLTDAPFMSESELYSYVEKWEEMNVHNYKLKHLVAADVLIKNLHLLHSNGILHNAIHESNYTWALELLDFELSCSKKHPYDNEDYRRHVVDLYPREITSTYRIITYIAAILKEKTNFMEIERIFREYGFDLNAYRVSC